MSDDAIEHEAGSSPVADSLGGLVERLLLRGRRTLGRAARRGRLRLELRQLERDRDHFWMRLGKTAYHLVEAGEIDHPGLRKAIARIDELEARIRALEARARSGDEG